MKGTPPASRGGESYHRSVGRKSLIVRMPKAVFGGLADEAAEIAACLVGSGVSLLLSH